MIAVISVIVVLLMGVPLGILAAIKRSTLVDASITVYAMILAAIPGFWLALILIYFFAMMLGWFPVFGAETWRHFVLPVITLSVPASSAFIRQTRVLMLDVVSQEYIKTARAKGAPEYIVIWKHAFKNAVLPLINSTGMLFSGLLGGAIIVETIFSINGIGRYMLLSVQNRDIPVVMCCSIILSTLFCLIVLVIDLFYAFVDPRIRAKFMT
jgi:peptide/nickel transport system permease protein